jgi:hypothetical protein
MRGLRKNSQLLTHSRTYKVVWVFAVLLYSNFLVWIIDLWAPRVPANPPLYIGILFRLITLRGTWTSSSSILTHEGKSLLFHCARQALPTITRQRFLCLLCSSVCTPRSVTSMRSTRHVQLKLESRNIGSRRSFCIVGIAERRSWSDCSRSIAQGVAMIAYSPLIDWLVFYFK